MLPGCEVDLHMGCETCVHLPAAAVLIEACIELSDALASVSAQESSD
jgi:hypothetical protein